MYFHTKVVSRSPPSFSPRTSSFLCAHCREVSARRRPSTCAPHCAALIKEVWCAPRGVSSCAWHSAPARLAIITRLPVFYGLSRAGETACVYIYTQVFIYIGICIGESALLQVYFAVRAGRGQWSLTFDCSIRGARFRGDSVASLNFLRRSPARACSAFSSAAAVVFIFRFIVLFIIESEYIL